jgi:arylsulfatase A-like enzyme
MLTNNSRKTFRSTVIVLSALCMLLSSCSGKEKMAASGPNIILILADDLGYGDLSCYGQEVLSTPNIDQMAAEGIRFLNHYAGSTVCAPSRASLLSGLHTGHVSVRGNSPNQLLNESDPGIAKMLKEAGYITGIIGKWGVGHPPPPDDPNRNGFDYSFGYINMWHAHNFYPEFLYRNGEKVYLEGNRLYSEKGENPWKDQPEGTGVAVEKGQYVHPLFDEETIRFIERNRDTTFFLYLALNVPHANNEAGKYLGDGMEVEDYGEFTDKPWPDPEKGFAVMIRNIDNTVGIINNKLNELGIDKNTLVIFTSDNGPHNEGNHSADYFSSSGILRGAKRDLYEGGIRVPFIAKWPGIIEPGSVSDHVSTFWDYLPSFTEIANFENETESDGISFLPALIGKPEKQEKHPFLYWEFYEQGGKQAVLMDHWKAIRFNTRTGNHVTELYNLEQDISETNNLAAEYPEVLDQLTDLMEEAHTPHPLISLYNQDVNAETPF